MAIIHLNHIDLSQNELQNAVIQNLATAPSSPREGQTYWNSSTKKWMIFNGTEWQECAKNYTLPPATTTTLGGVIVGSNLTVAADGTISTDIQGAASTVISDNLTAGRVVVSNTNGKIDVSDITTTELGYLDNAASNIQEQLNSKVTGNAAITGATKCKITYDSKGLVTSGANLAASDIPNLASNKITAMTSYAKASSSAAIGTSDSLNTAIGKLEYKVDNAVIKNSDITASTSGKTVITYDEKGLVTGGDEIGIASGSTNYLGFDTSTHKISAKVDTTVTENSTKLITSGAVHTAIQNSVVGGVVYQGTWDITSATDYSGITLPVKKGYLYYVTGTGTKTIGGIEWSAGDYLLVNEDVATGGSLSGKVEKIDNSESADIVRLNATQTLTNKTIDADDNTISDLTTSNLKSGVLQTSVRASGTATDTSLASEKAVRTELDKKQDKIVAGTANDIVAYSGTKGTFGTLTRTTSVRESSTASDTYIPTEKAVATAVEALPHKFTATNPALTQSGGVCTWTVTHGLTDGDVVATVKRVSDGKEVVPEISYTTTAVVVKINSTSNISAGVYKIVVIG